MRYLSLQARQGSLPVPHDTSRHDLVPLPPECPSGQRGFPRLRLLAVGGMPPSARYRECGVRCLCDASTAHAALLQPGTFGTLLCLFSHAGLFVPATSHMATVIAGTLAPHHHAGINKILSKPLTATGLEADFAPRHYRISRGARSALTPSVSRRSAPRRAGSDGRSGPPARSAKGGQPPLEPPAGGKDLTTQGASVRATRNPTKMLRLSVGFPQRNATRRTLGK